MLKKLIRHEWASGWKIPTVLIGVLLVLSVFAGLTFVAPVWDSEMTGLSILLVIVWMLYYFAIIGVSVGVMLYLAIRFYKSMYTDEGYLTHTLPVTSHQLLWSKMIYIAAWNIIATIAIFLSVFIFGFMAALFLQPDGMGVMESFTMAWEEIVAEFGAENIGAFAGNMVFVGIAGVCSSTMLLVGSITIGQLVGKHKVLGAVGAYFAVNTIMQIISYICMFPIMFKTIENEPDNVFAVLTPMYTILSVVCIIVSIALYFISELIIRKKLNLD